MSFRLAIAVGLNRTLVHSCLSQLRYRYVWYSCLARVSAWAARELPVPWAEPLWLQFFVTHLHLPKEKAPGACFGQARRFHQAPHPWHEEWIHTPGTRTGCTSHPWHEEWMHIECVARPPYGNMYIHTSICPHWCRRLQGSPVIQPSGPRRLPWPPPCTNRYCQLSELDAAPPGATGPQY